MDDQASKVSSSSLEDTSTSTGFKTSIEPTPSLVHNEPSSTLNPDHIPMPPPPTSQSLLTYPHPPTSQSPTPTSQTQTETNVEGRGTKRKEREPKHISEVWEHFVRLPLEETKGEHLAACKHCHTTYKADPNRHGTDSLLRHIPKCKENPNKATTNRRQSMLSLLSGGSSSQGRSVVAHLYNEKRCRRVLVKFIISDEQPFRIVEKLAFKKLLNEFEPHFPIPSRITIGRDVWQLYLGEVKLLKKFLQQSAKRVCLTTDCWTSCQNFNYMCLTAHFIDEDWKLHKRILNFVMIENHRGDTIGKTIEQCLLQWGIENIFTITIDNASANDTELVYLKRCLRSWMGLLCDGNYIQLRCCTHVLNLVVNKGIKEMKDSFETIRSAVRYVRSSPSRFLKFKT